MANQGLDTGCQTRYSLMPFAPIALFVFRRPRHVELALRSLLLNPELQDSPFYIFCDGPRGQPDVESVKAARNVVRALAPRRAKIIERSVNLGLDHSVIKGVGELCERYGRVIVLEDDLEVAPDFLRYMNTALDLYASDEQVMQVSGYQFPVEINGSLDAVFLPFTTSWGWATWSRAWRHFNHAAPGHQELKVNRAKQRSFDLDGCYPYFRMLNRNLAKPVPAWDIVFYSNVFDRSGLTLHPCTSLVRNNGFDGSGSTCGRFATAHIELTGDQPPIRFPEMPAIDHPAYRTIKKYLRHESRPLMKLVRRIQARVS